MKLHEELPNTFQDLIETPLDKEIVRKRPPRKQDPVTALESFQSTVIIDDLVVAGAELEELNGNVVERFIV